MNITSEDLKKLIQNSQRYAFQAREWIIDPDRLLDAIRKMEAEDARKQKDNPSLLVRGLYGRME